MSQLTQPKPFRFSIPMRARFSIGVLLCVCCLSCTGVISAQPVGDDLTFPYQAIVAKEGAQVYAADITEPAEPLPDGVVFQKQDLVTGSWQAGSKAGYYGVAAAP